ncbi:tryptophan synthase subunit beta [bacterium]|nr:tryptophan synthase subunit beta [bacterium]
MKVKICGITNAADAALSLEAGAEYLGFVFANSPRMVSRESASEILASLDRSRFKAVGVFKDQSIDDIVAICGHCGLDIVQLHGDFSAADLALIRQRCARPLMLAVYPLPELYASGLELAREDSVDYLLLDARGLPFDWRLAEQAKALGKPVFLAGGLTPEIVRLACEVVQPYGVDVASGVEAGAGRKDPAAVRAFCRSVSEATAIASDRGTSGHAGHSFAPRGRFGAFGQSHGGAYVPETLVPALEALEREYQLAISDTGFQLELDGLLRNYAGRATPLYHAARLSSDLGAEIYLKREDLLHTGAHKLNNCLGQALLARRMGKRRIIAETGAGQHGVGTATVCALLGLDCVVYMGAEDVQRQAPNVQRMKLLGAEVRPVTAGTQTLKDATSEAIRDWVTNVNDSYYLIGSTVGPHPYPSMVRDFQRVIGIEARAQMLEQAGGLPDSVIACVGGGSNALGIFHAFLYDREVALLGAEAGGEGLDGAHAATLTMGRPGVLHGALSYLLQDTHGQVSPVHSISAGLDYPGVGPEHSFLKDVGRVKYHAVTDAEALAAFQMLARLEGILPALESSHALALAAKQASAQPGSRILVNLSGRGDKDLGIVTKALGLSGEVRP